MPDILRTQPSRVPIEYPEYLEPKKPPASISENIFEVPVQFEQDPLILSIRTSLAEGRNAAERSYQLALAAMSDERQTEVSRHKSASDNVLKATGPALQKLQGTIERVAKKIGDLENFLAGPPEPTTATAHWRAMEIRNALASMKREDRRKIVLDALRKGDPSIAAAVLRVAPFLVGIDAVEQEEYRLLWSQSAHPNESAYLATLKDIEGHLDRGGKLLLDYGFSLSSPVLVKRADQSQRRADAALAGLAA